VDATSRAWFWAIGAMLFLFIAASAAPAPLYRVHQEEWGFSATTLTAFFAVYVVTLLATLLFLGSLSDHVGRRPIMAAGLFLEAAACLVFVFAGGVEALFVARGVQGLAVGLAAGALNAALLDMRRGGELAPLIASTSPNAGLGFGAVATSVLVQYGPAPTQLAWWLFLAGFVASLGVWQPCRSMEGHGPGRWRRCARI
jgi:MFS family permease